MRRLLVISSPFFNYQISIANAFRTLGYEVEIETYDEPIHPFRGWTKWRHKFSRNKESLKEQSRQKYKKYIERRFDEIKPEIVFIYDGTIIKDETLDYFRQKGTKVAIWMYDSIRRKGYEMCESHIDHSDLFCCFENQDVEYFRSIGKTAKFLPLACDTNVYYPIKSEKDIDILFVGTIYTSEKRIKYLEDLVERYKDKNIVIYGLYKPWFKNPIAWLTRKHRQQFKNVNIQPEEVNRLFARTKIALNIHHKQTFEGANQRVMETCGAGAYQICDSNPYIKSLFPNGEVGLYETEEEMFEKIDYALTHDMSDEAKRGYETVVRNHTFLTSAKQIIEWL